MRPGVARHPRSTPRRSQSAPAREAVIVTDTFKAACDEADKRAAAEKARVEKEQVEADRHDGFTMDPVRGLEVEVIKGSGKNERIEILWLSAPFRIVGRVRDPRSEGWARLLSCYDDDRRDHQYA